MLRISGFPLNGQGGWSGYILTKKVRYVNPRLRAVAVLCDTLVLSFACVADAAYIYPMRTERLTVLLEPAEKIAIDTRAAEMSVSAGELVRRALDAYDPDADPAMLEALAGELTDSVARIDSKISKLDSVLDRADRLDGERDAYRAEMRRELAGQDMTWLLD